MITYCTFGLKVVHRFCSLPLCHTLGVLAFTAVISTPLCFAESEAPNSLVDLTLEELLEVKISIATKTPEPKLLLPGTVYTITEDEIKRFGWRDLREILAALPILHTHNSYDWFSLNLRGGGANLILLLIDGHEVQNLVADEALIQNSFPAFRIKRVEVLMGSHSTLYGSNSADGVINIITKHGANSQEDRNEAQYIRGDAGTQVVSANMRHQYDDGYIGLSASAFQSNYNWKELTDFVQDNDLWSRHPNDANRDYSNPITAPYRSYSIGVSVEKNGLYSGANIWQDSGPQGYGEVFSYWGERRSIRNFGNYFAGAKYQFAGIDGFVEYIYTQESDYFLEPEWNGSLEPTRHRIKSEARRTIGRHALVAGYDGYIQKTLFRNDSVSSGGDGVIHLFPKSLIEEFNTHKNSLFINDSIDIVKDKIKGVIGARYDAYKDVDNQLTPKLSLIYSPTESSAIRLIYSGGFRAPNGFDSVNAKNAGINSLPPIKSDMYEIG